MVVDEYGGVAGVLTVKDLLEPLVGDLHDEFDTPTRSREIVRVDGHRWLVDGRTSVDEVRDRLGIDVPDGEYVTLGGFLFDGFGHIPTEGEPLLVDGWDLRVVEMDKRRIAKVRRPPPSGKPERPRRGGRHAGRGRAVGGGWGRPDAGNVDRSEPPAGPGRHRDDDALGNGPGPRRKLRAGPAPWCR